MTSEVSVQHTITVVLQTADTEGQNVMDRLLPLVYDELRSIASHYLARERRGHTLSTTALVHEAYLKLVDPKQVPLRNRAYFFGAATQAMREILVEHARRRTRQKRGGREQPVRLEEQHLLADDFAVELLDLDEALNRLAAFDRRAAQVVECRFFGGLTTEETAEVLGQSTRTVNRDWMTAKAWLFRALHDEDEA